MRGATYTADVVKAGDIQLKLGELTGPLHRGGRVAAW
jgi:hypothetical protein